MLAAAPHVLVVDDHSDIRELLSLFLRRHGRRATAVDGAEPARKALQDQRFDLVLLDIMLPGEDGLSLCRDIRKASAVPVILLSALGGDLDRIVGLEVGADDYVAKPFHPRELLARIDAVLRRTHGLPPDVSPPRGEALAFDRWILEVAERTLIDADGAVVELSASEHRLLLTFLRRPNIALTRDQLLELAFSHGDEIMDRAVDRQVSRLRRKIEIDPRAPTLIQTVWGGGYVLAAPVDKL